MNDGKIEKAFRDANFWGNDNIYFLGMILPTATQHLLLGVFANAKLKSMLINKMEKGIGIIPLNQFSGRPEPDKIQFISDDNIESVTFKSGGLFWYKKIMITLKTSEKIAFKVTKRNMAIKKHRENVNRFINLYSDANN